MLRYRFIAFWFLLSYGNICSQADADRLVIKINQSGELCDDDFEQANQSFLEVEKQLQDQQGLDSILAVFYHKWGVCAYWHDEFDLAIDRYQRALHIRQKIFEAPHPDLARSNMNIGIVKKYQEEYSEARQYLELALVQWELLENQELIAQSHFEIGWTLQDAGDLDGALLHQNQALEMYRDLYGPMEYDVAFTKELRAITYDLLGDNEKAIQELKGVAEIYQALEDSVGIANAMHNLGNSYDRSDLPVEAIEAFLKSLNLNKSMGPGQIAALADDYSGLGTTHHKMGNVKKAQLYADSAQAIWLALHTGRHPELAAGFDNLGNILESKGESERAIAYYDSAILQLLPDSILKLTKEVSFSPIEQKPELLIILHDKTISLRHLINDKTKVEFLPLLMSTYREIIDLVHKMQSQFYSESTKLHWVSVARKIYGEAIAFCYDRNRIEKTDYWIAKAVEFTEESKALILYQQFSESKVDPQSPLGEDLAKARMQNRKVAYWTKKNLEEPSEMRRSLDSLLYWRGQKESFSVQMKLQHPFYAQMQSQSDQFVLKNFQKNLPKDVLCLSFQRTQEHFYCLAISKKETNFGEIHITDEMLASILRAKKSISSPEVISDFDLQGMLKGLYRNLFAPVLNELNLSETHWNNIVILPDGELHGLPFEIFKRPDDQNSTYLVRDFAFSYHYSLNLYEKSKSKKSVNWKNANLSVIAPDYEGSSLPPLEGVKLEIEQLLRPYPDAGVVTASRGFSTLLSKQNLSSDILHFAMHGGASQSSRYDAYLAFPEGKDSTFLLYNWQLSALPIETQLVVLSACETGAGQLESGEGIYSLGRGFFAAGVPNLVMANWKSNDGSTALIMGSFYKNLASQIPPHKALQLAKIAYLDEPLDEEGHPYYWAHLNYTGFIPGNPRSYWSLGWLGLVIAVAGLFWIFRRGRDSV